MARASYGIDAPGSVVRLGGFGAGLIALSAAFTLLEVPVLRGPAQGCLFTGITLLLVAAFMLFSSLVLKFGLCDRLVRDLGLTGGEQVLDVGCGRGLALIACAKRLTTGRATGVDLWSTEDLSANRPEATSANATAAGVADRVQVDTGDARALPYPDASFDAVISMTAIHNIKDAAGRRQALREMVRVLKPGGRLALFDIFHPFEYRAPLRQAGIEPLHAALTLPLWALPGVRLWGRKAG